MKACAAGCVLLSSVGGDDSVRDGGALRAHRCHFHKISENHHQSFSPTAVGERRPNLPKDLRSKVMRWQCCNNRNDRLLEALVKVTRTVSGIPFAPTPHRHLPKQVMFRFHSGSSKRYLGLVGDATIHERAVSILRQLPWLALQHIRVQQQRVSSTEQG